YGAEGAPRGGAHHSSGQATSMRADVEALRVEVSRQVDALVKTRVADALHVGLDQVNDLALVEDANGGVLQDDLLRLLVLGQGGAQIPRGVGVLNQLVVGRVVVTLELGSVAGAGLLDIVEILGVGVVHAPAVYRVHLE